MTRGLVPTNTTEHYIFRGLFEAFYAAWINGWKASAWAGIVGYRTSTGTELIFGDNDIPHVEQEIGVLNIRWVDCCGGNRYFKGIIDEIIIFDRALSEDKIEKLATQGLAVEPLNKLATTRGRIKRSGH